MYSALMSGALVGVDACMVRVEADASNGLPSFNMVGLLGSEVRESRERVWAALKNADLNIPPMRITINLSPADLRKEGTAYDLPIAIAMLTALGDLPMERAKGMLLLGELGLNGEVKRVRGVLPIVREAKKNGIMECIVPYANAGEAAVIPGMKVWGVHTLEEVVRFLKTTKGEEVLTPITVDQSSFAEMQEETIEDFSEICGQEHAKRAAVIAAAGFHNLLMVGPPGSGKSMLAKRIPGIMPVMSIEESLEVTAIASVGGILQQDALVKKRPFQSPHHTISLSALTGGGMVPRPGLVTLAHRGVLFLDELPEFQRNVIDGLRQPIEEHQVQVVRVGGNITYPAEFMLIGAMNPCPCGFYPDRNRCRCNEMQIKRYMSRVSGPILDRIDLCVELQEMNINSLIRKKEEKTSAELRKQVEIARKWQMERFAGSAYRFNAQIRAADMGKYCALGKAEEKLMEEIYRKMGLSARSYHRILKVSRTIADLEESVAIEREHLLEATAYRPAQDYWI